jgi:formylglycine-generating enzyme required for sulfatase activity
VIKRHAVLGSLLSLGSLLLGADAGTQEVKPTSTPASANGGAPSGSGGGMVSVPGGAFVMGCNKPIDSECANYEEAGRMVEGAAFSIDRTEVTVAAYARCRDAQRCSSSGLEMPYFDGRDQPEFAEFCNWQKPGREHHPINCLTWDQAAAFCAWAGKRLPTEAEWEKAARGTNGRKYPWGNASFGSGGKVANIADEAAKRRFPQWTIAAGYDDGVVGTAPVGSFPAGAAPSGALDMIGNVFEWTADALAEGRAVRGGSWDAGPSGARASSRSWVGAENRNANVGFRCAR